MATEEFLGMVEAAHLCGLSRRRLHELRQSGNFPEPDVVVAASAGWKRETLRRWAKLNGRSLREVLP